MHEGNRKLLRRCKTQYYAHFHDCAVLELGALDWNGSVREYFTRCQYVGVDHVAGPNVDVVADGEATQFTPGQFDTFVCCSVFEHTPRWREILTHNLQWVRAGGLVVLVWGAEGNQHHAPEPWCPVPSDVFLAFVRTQPLTILEAFMENDDCPGAYDLIARKV